ncbi:unnamed protein product [Alopecurus aequalis]
MNGEWQQHNSDVHPELDLAIASPGGFTMNGEWQQFNSDVHPELDLAIASPGELNLILQDLGDDFGGVLGLGPNTPMGNTGDASAAAAAAADQDSNGGETQSEQRTAAGRPNRKRHDRDQIIELEAAFRENQHPDEKERAELGTRVGISAPQVKFWFQNRRAAQKIQVKKRELNKLREEKEALQAERQALISATQNNTCLACRGLAAGAGERHHLLCENMRLKEILQRESDFLTKVSGGRATEAMPVAMPCGSHGPAATNHNASADKGKALAADHAPPSHRAVTGPMMPANEGVALSQHDTKNMLIKIGAQASNEFRILVYSGMPMWMPTPDGEAEMLNLQSYIDTLFPSIFGPYRVGRHVDGTRKTGDVMCTADTLVGVLMDAVTWIVNMEYEVGGIFEEYHPLLRSGQALGACRWIASLQRQCAYLAIVHSYNRDMTRDGRMNIFDLARMMTTSFCEVVRGPRSRPWRRLGEWSSVCGTGVDSFKVLARVVTFPVGNGGAVVLNVVAPVWLPGIPPQQVFDYLCDENRRGEWDSLANGAPVLREGYFPAGGQLPGNAISVLRTIASDGTPSGQVILQEACADTSCMVLAYAIMDEQSLQHAMNNGGPAAFSVLPSGVVILPDGASPASAACSSSTAVTHGGNAGSLVSVIYQTLLNKEPSYETIDNVGNLLCRVIRRIKDAVHANSVAGA